jgi:hypothetical protein
MGSIQGGYNVTRSQPTVARTFKYQVSLYTSPGAGDSNSYAGRNTVTGAPHDIQCDEAASHNSETDVTKTATWYNMLEIQACSENNCQRLLMDLGTWDVGNAILSLLILICASSIFLNRSASPMTRAASLTSRQVSSKRVITLTMVPSATSVNEVIWSKGLIEDSQLRRWLGSKNLNTIPFAHSYTTSTSPTLRVDLNSSTATLCRS